MGAQPQTIVSETLLAIFTFYPDSTSLAKRNGGDRMNEGGQGCEGHYEEDLPVMTEITPNGFLVPSED